MTPSKAGARVSACKYRKHTTEMPRLNSTAHNADPVVLPNRRRDAPVAKKASGLRLCEAAKSSTLLAAKLILWVDVGGEDDFRAKARPGDNTI
jgi:hypothetical protein